MILYRHFASKADLYRAVLERDVARLRDVVGADTFDDASIAALLRAASADPAAFRLLFRHAPREPEFRDVMDAFRSTATEITLRHLDDITDDRWRRWAAALLPTLSLEVVIASSTRVSANIIDVYSYPVSL